MPMVVKIRMTFEDGDGNSVTADIHSQNGITVHGRIWPADLDLVNAIQKQITERRDRYVSKKPTSVIESLRQAARAGDSIVSKPTS